MKDYIDCSAGYSAPPLPVPHRHVKGQGHHRAPQRSPS